MADKEPTATAAAAAKSTEVNRCLVYCRIRPDKPHDYEDGATPLLEVARNKSIVIKDEKTYDFDGAYNNTCTQEQIFDAAGRPCVLHCLKGFRASIMAYGQTGTGKTFTLCNTKPGHEGVVPRAASLLFDTIRADTSRSYTVSAQFVQIYRDNLGDLLSESGRDKVDIVYDREGGVTLPGSTSRDVASADDLMALFAEGDKRRVTTATAMNPESSRGHSALVIWVASQSADEDAAVAGGRRVGKLTIIDLAGYERFSKTGISNSNPIMKDEAKTINASLLSLGHVVTSLSNGDKHIPWRNAKLTRLLQDSIGGRSRTTIILTVGPSSNHLHESTNTLQFGQRSMAVKVQSKVTEIVDHAKLAAKLQRLLDEKQSTIDELEVKLTRQQQITDDMLARQQRDATELHAQHEAELDRLRSEGASDEKLRSVAQQQAVERDNLAEQQREEVVYAAERNANEAREEADEQVAAAGERAAVQALEFLERIKDLEGQLRHANAEIDRLSGGGEVPADAAATTSPAQDDDQGAGGADRRQEGPRDWEQVAGELEAELSDFDRRLAAKNEVTLELQIQLDKMAGVARERAEEIDRLEDELAAAKKTMKSGGAATTVVADDDDDADDSQDDERAYAEALKTARRRARTVDLAEVEAAQAVMEAEMATKDSDIADLNARVAELEEALRGTQPMPSAGGSTTPGAQRGSGRARSASLAAGSHADPHHHATSMDASSTPNNSFSAMPFKSARAGPPAVPALGLNLAHDAANADTGASPAPPIPMTARGRRGTMVGGAAVHQQIQRLEADKAALEERIEVLEDELSSAVACLRGEEDAPAHWQPHSSDTHDNAAADGGDGGGNERDADPDELLEIRMLEQEKAQLMERAVAAQARAEEAEAALAAAKDDLAARPSREEAGAAMQQLADAFGKVETLTAELEEAQDALAAAKKEAKEASDATSALRRDVDAADERVAEAKAEATLARQNAAAALQSKETLARDKVRLQMEIDDIKEDQSTAVDVANARAEAIANEIPPLRDAAREAEDARDEAKAQLRAAELKLGAAEKRAADADARAAEAVNAARSQAESLAVETSAEEKKKLEDDVARLTAEVDALKAASAQSASAIKMAELQSKLVVAQRQSDQQRAEWTAASARHKDAEARLVAAHEQHAAHARAIGADRDAAETRAREAVNETQRLVRHIAELKLKNSNLTEEVQTAQVAASEASVRATGQRSAAVVERSIAVMNEQHEALVSHLQNAIFAARSGAADASSVKGEREALVAVMRALRAKYTALQSSMAQLCAHVVECHAVMKHQKDGDLTQRLTTTNPLDNPGTARDLAGMLAERDDALHQKDQLVVDLTVELEQLRNDDGSNTRQLVVTSTEDEEGGSDAASPLQSPRGSAAAVAQTTANGYLEWAQFREQMQNLERNLRRRVDDANRATAKFQILREQLERLNIAPETDVKLADGSANRAGAAALTREQLAGETSIDTTDLQILLDCKEAELRVVTYRLEQRERALAAMTDHVHQLRRLLSIRLNEEKAAAAAAASVVDVDATAPGEPSPSPARQQGGDNADVDDQEDATASPITKMAHTIAGRAHASRASGGQSRADAEAIRKAIGAMAPETSARDQLEGLLAVMKALRKQNGILHSQLCDRGALLRHFAWLLVHHGILPANYDLNSIAGDQSAELRLAFAERDEELFLKDQALLQRSAEVVLLEQTVRDLAAQLEGAGIKPDRPVTNISADVMRAQRDTQRDVLNREQSRARLHERHAVLLQETQEVDAMVMAYTVRLCELEEEESAAAQNGSTDAKAQLEELRGEVMDLRVRKDQLANALAIVDAQCSAHENEVRLLRQVLAQSTRAVQNMHERTASFGDDADADGSAGAEAADLAAANPSQQPGAGASSSGQASVGGGMMRRLMSRFTSGA